MSGLRESVRIITPTGELSGCLFVGVDGLPELEIVSPTTRQKGRYRPATLPAAWSLLMDIESPGLGPLFHAWRDIEDVRRAIREAQREAEAEERREPDCIDLAKADMEARGTR